MIETTHTTTTSTSMSTIPTTQTSTMTSPQPNYEATMGSDESEDDWEDSDTDNDTGEAPHQLQTPDGFKSSDGSQTSIPNFTFQQLQAMNEKLRLKHFIHDANGFTLYRDEPYVNKQYPGLEMNSEMFVGESVYITQALYYKNGNRVPVRVPDVKSKKIILVRNETGMFLETKTVPNNCVFFKKKAIDKKTGKDAAFELGINYSSHTMGVPSQFVFVAIPVQNGVLMLDKAQRSPKFYVKSKRQERFLPQSKKRRKKNVEHLRINTDIQAAERTYNILLASLTSLQHDNREYTKILSTVKSVLPLMPNGAVHIALVHGTRPMFNENIVNL